MNAQPTLFPPLPAAPRRSPVWSPKEWKLIPLRECAPPSTLCDTPERAAEYWRSSVATSPAFSGRVECFVVVLVNTRRRILGHVVVATGLLDTILVHPREVFAAACVANAAGVLLMHNHPSGDPTPSEADIKVTRDLIRAGQLMRIDVLDHVVMGLPSADRRQDWISLRELGYFALNP